MHNSLFRLLTDFRSPPWRGHVREARFEMFVVVVDTRAIGDHAQQIRGDRVSAADHIIVVPKPDSCQRDPGHSPKELVAVMENVPHEPQFNLSVPIPFEVGSGLNWAIASYGDKIKGKKGWLI